MMIRARDAAQVAGRTWIPCYIETGIWSQPASAEPRIASLRESDLARGPGVQVAWAPVRHLHDELVPMVSQAVGEPVIATEMHGPMLYHKGARVEAHIDRYPAQMFCLVLTLDADAPWHIRTLDLSVRLRNLEDEIALNPGTFTLYEGARLLHERPAFEGNRIVLAHLYYRPETFTQDRPTPSST